MWGILPFGSSLLAILVIFIPERRRGMRRSNDSFSSDKLLAERMAS
jgi:hypothetical protein